MKLLSEIKIELENNKLNEKLSNFEIIENKLLFENDDNKFEIIIDGDEINVNYISKCDDYINNFNYEISNNKINDCNIDEWVENLFNDLYDICEYDEDF